MKFNKERGQALLIVVLIMVVALTVGLSLGSRTIINIRTSSEEADSQKALVAAEAGIEQALRATTSTTIKEEFIENKTVYNAVVEEVKGTSFLANGGNLVLQDDGIDVWLVKHDADGKPDYSTSWGDNKKLNIYWGDPALDDCDNAAIEVAVISGTQAAPVLKRYAYDPCGSRKGANNFSNVPGAEPDPVEGKIFKYKVQIDIDDGLVARVVPIYASTAIAVYGNGTALPTQGFNIDSTGTSGALDREVKRSLTFFRAYDQLPTQYFMYGLFSPEQL